MDDITRIVMDVLSELRKKGILEQDHGDDQRRIPVGISNRHVHLSPGDLECLFGKGATLSAIKDLSQPGQYASKESVMLIGPKGYIDNVRILGPPRGRTQVELLAQDTFKLGVAAPLRLSGSIDDTPGITICGPNGCIQIEEGVIVAKRHIHMTPGDAKRFGCHDGEVVRVVCSGERGGVLDNVLIRVTETSGLDFHIDTEEANCMGLKNQDSVTIIK